MNPHILAALAVAFSLAAAGCLGATDKAEVPATSPTLPTTPSAEVDPSPPKGEPVNPSPPPALAVKIPGAKLHAVSAAGVSEEVAGWALFASREGQVTFSLVTRALTPGAHGTHVHAGASCDPTPATDSAAAVPAGKAGGHFNPGNATHGAHAGDLPNMMVGADGRGAHVGFVDGVTLTPGVATSVIGRTVVVHAGADDGVTDPSGNSGARVLCGVIGQVDLAEVGELLFADLNPVTAAGVDDVSAGVAMFHAFDDALYVMVLAQGLTPGAHGTHVHAGASCDPTPATDSAAAVPAGKAGGHFNPGNATHGAHAGDLPNMMVGEDGRAAMSTVSTTLALSGAASVENRALVVHAGADDGVTDPSGNSGARVMCGVVAPLF